MTVKSAQAISGSFATVGATGALTAATGTPVGTLHVAGVANGAAVTITGANPYKFAVTLPALVAGDVVQVYVTATIAGIATGGFVWDDVADTALNSDAVTLGATQPAINWGAQTISNNAGAALTLASTGGNGAGLAVTGNGSGAGISATGGASGHGMAVTGQGVGDGLRATAGATSSDAISAVSTNGDGIYVRGGRVGVNILGNQLDTGNVPAVSIANDGWTNGVGLYITGQGNGAGVDIQSYGAGPGVKVTQSGTTSGVSITTAAGDGINVAATGGDGIQVVGTVTDINADITGNLSGSVGSVTDTASIAAAVWTYATRTLTSLSALVASVAAAVWAYATRTLTQSAASVAAVVAGSEITVYRGDTWSISLTGLGAITGHTDVWFTVKNSPTETDAEALVQVSQTVGLERLNGAAATAAQGSLVVDDASAGNITVTVAAAASAQIATAENLVYDVQWKTATGEIHTLTANVINVSGDVTRATS